MQFSSTFSALVLTCVSVFGFASHSTAAKHDTIHLHEGLKVVQLSKNCWMHISYIPYEGNQVPCNGLVYFNKGEAAVMDTPVNIEMSIILIEWIQHDRKAKGRYLVVNHFHEDCLGGLAAFMDRSFETFSQKKNCFLAKRDGQGCTMRYFSDTLSLNVGGQRIECWYPGEAHTVDNIVVYIPSDRVLFGGCMVKELGAGFGNISDAKTDKWSETVGRVKTKFSKVKIVVPGHGKPGSKKLLDYTIQLFEPKKAP